MVEEMKEKEYIVGMQEKHPQPGSPLFSGKSLGTRLPHPQEVKELLFCYCA